MYPLIIDNQSNAYGEWCDFFEPFWDADDRKNKLEQFYGLPIVDNDLKDWTGDRYGVFGENWVNLTEDIKSIFREIFRIKNSIQLSINTRIDDLKLPARYSSVHVRRGDKNNQFKSYGELTNLEIIKKLEAVLIDKSVENIFLMTDDYDVVEIMQEHSKLNIYTSCTPDIRGDARMLRISNGHTLDLLTELTVAKRSDSHFQTVNSRTSKLVRLLRQDIECFHIYNPEYSVDTAL